MTPHRAHLRVAIIGAGFSGIGMAIRLKQSGEEDFVVFEREAGVGGTWRVNQYPGCACDVPSHLYSFSFAPNPGWSHWYAPQPEIRDYLEKCCADFGIAPHLRLSTPVVRMEWDAGAKRWRIDTEAGEHWTADLLVLGVGGLSTPAYPSLPGLDRFEGKAFHSQAWQTDCALEGKRVAVIGTGASAIQFVPHVQKRAAHVDVYQRTPPWVLPRADRAVGALEQRVLGWAPGLQHVRRAAIYASLETRAFAFVKVPGLLRMAQHMAQRHLGQQIADPDLRRALTPDYTLGCKRVLLSDDYYPALAQPNVSLVTSPITEVRAQSIVTHDGIERAADVLVYGTGFRATDPLPRGLLFGLDGVDLGATWSSGPEAYKGTTVEGFPNAFFLMGPNTGLGHNSMIYMIESQIAYVLSALEYMQKRNLRSLHVRGQAQRMYNAWVQEKAQKAIWSVGGCKSWYLHAESGKNVSLWPDYTWAFRRITKRFDPDAYQAE